MVPLLLAAFVLLVSPNPGAHAPLLRTSSSMYCVNKKTHFLIFLVLDLERIL